MKGDPACSYARKKGANAQNYSDRMLRLKMSRPDEKCSGAANGCLHGRISSESMKGRQR